MAELKRSAKKRMILVVRSWQVGIAIGFLALTLWGFVRFPFAPITDSQNGLRDKLGNPQTVEEYQDFGTWERAHNWVGGLFAVTAVISAGHYEWKRRLSLRRKAPNQPSQPTPVDRRG